MNVVSGKIICIRMFLCSLIGWSFLNGDNVSPAIWWTTHKEYAVSSEPIDVVMVSHKKDLATLEKAVAGIRAYGKNIRKVFVVSETKLTDLAEWFDEKNYPFTKRDLALEIFDRDRKKAEAYLASENCRIGWIYQQLLKLYAPFVIPRISSNVLVLDADTIFLNPVEFIDAQGHALLTPGIGYHRPYFDHGKRLLLRFVRARPDSGIAHHMLVQRPILEDMFLAIRSIHHSEPWQAFCKCINHLELQRPISSTMSEYELYFNFACTRTRQVKIRPLKWKDMKLDEQEIEKCQQAGFHYVACHSYMQ